MEMHVTTSQRKAAQDRITELETLQKRLTMENKILRQNIERLLLEKQEAESNLLKKEQAKRPQTRHGQRQQQIFVQRPHSAR